MSATAKNQRMLPRGLQYVAVTVIVLFVCVPLVAMLLVSVMPDADAAAGLIVPSELRLDNYLRMWSTLNLGPGLANSLVTSLAASVLATIVATGFAYCLVRLTFLGRRTILQSMVGLQTLPSTLLILPLFVFFYSVSNLVGITIIGTRTGLSITYLTFALPFATWVMVTYLRSMPVSLEEAGLVDGLNRVGVLFRIIVPLAVPGMVVATIFSFLLGWNDILFASVLTNPETRTVSLLLNAFSQAQDGGGVPLYGQLMAGAVVTALPVVVLYLVFQRYLAAGLTAGSVKG